MAATASGSGTTVHRDPAGSATATATATTSPDVAGIRTVDDLAAALGAVGPDRWQSLAATTQGTRDLVLSAWSARLASAVLLGETVDPAATASAARPRVIDQTAPLVYGFEVVAAQSTGRRRTRALETLDALRRLDLAVSGATTSTPGGWALPFPVTTPLRRSASRPTCSPPRSTRPIEVAGAAPDGPALDDAARWSARVQSLAVDWGMPLSPFPGTAT